MPYLARERELAQRLHVLAAQNDPNSYAEFVFGVHQHPIHRIIQNRLTQHQYVSMDAPIEHGKELTLDTKIPTPSGWTIMAAIRRGDTVFDRRGAPCRVTFATPVQFRKQVYRLHFDDGSSIEAGAGHQWVVLGKQPEAKCKNVLRGDRVVTTAQMLEEGIAFPVPAKRKDGTPYHEYRWRIPLAEPVDYARRLLPIHPYVLGVWLGDGNSADARVTFGAGDREVYERCQLLEGNGYRARENRPGVFSGTLGTRRPASSKRDPLRMREKLRSLGVLGNKHIPAEYLTASIEQRRELLAGLLDTDGSISGRNPRVELTLCSLRLAEDATELVRSLGFKTSMRTNAATLRGRVVGERHRIMFVAHEPVFRLQRKLDRQRLGKPTGRTSYRCVTRIEEIPSAPVRCISVDSPDQTYLAGRDYTVTHNTTQVDVVRPTWEIGRNTGILIALLSNSTEIPERVMRDVTMTLQENENYHLVFPHVEVQRATSDRIYVKREGSQAHPTMVGMGIMGAVIGTRVSLLILDDILDVKNTYSENERRRVWTVITSTLLGRVTKLGRIWDIGTPWHVEDARHELRRLQHYVHVHFDATDGTHYLVNGERVEIEGRHAGDTLWPEVVMDANGHEWGWPVERLEMKRAQLPVVEFDRQFRCVASAGSLAYFKAPLLDYAVDLGEQLGLGTMPVPARSRYVWTGVDLAVGKKATHDLTVMHSGTIMPGRHGIARATLDVRYGRWSPSEIIAQMLRILRFYPNHMGFCVENVAAQDYLLQIMQDTTIMTALGWSDFDQERCKIYPHTTGVEKHDPVIGITGMAFWFEQRRWAYPGGRPLDDEIARTISGLLAYDPTAHTSDFVMAQWFFSEQVRNAAVHMAGGASEMEQYGVG